MFGHLPDELINKILSYNYVKPKYLMEMKLAGKLLNKCDEIREIPNNLVEDSDGDIYYPVAAYEVKRDEFEEFLDYFPLYIQTFFDLKLFRGVPYNEGDGPIYIKERRMYSWERRNYLWQQDDPIAKLNDVFELRFMT